jgi:hypothetical protein
VATRYADWSRTDDGIKMMVLFAALAWSRFGGFVSRKDYKDTVRSIAKQGRLPLRDAEVMARGQCELIRCGLLSTGQTSACRNGNA